MLEDALQLTRDNVTTAARVMLPTYPILYGAAGLIFIGQAASRTSGPAFDVARFLLPIPVWGLVFLLVACAELYALLRHSRRTYINALVAGAGLAWFWAVLISSSAAGSVYVSWTSGLWVAGVGVAQAASARSLARQEWTL